MQRTCSGQQKTRRSGFAIQMVRARGLDVLKTIENSKTPEGGNYVPFGRLAIHTIFGGLLYVNDSAMTVHEKHVRHATELRRVLAKLALYRSERLRCSLLVRPYVGIAGNDDLSDFLYHDRIAPEVNTQTSFARLSFPSRRKTSRAAKNPPKRVSQFRWCGREDLNLHGVAPIRT